MSGRVVITTVVAVAIAFGVGCLIYAGVLFLRPMQPEEGPRFTSADGSKSIVVMIGRDGIDSTTTASTATAPPRSRWAASTGTGPVSQQSLGWAIIRRPNRWRRAA